MNIMMIVHIMSCVTSIQTTTFIEAVTKAIVKKLMDSPSFLEMLAKNVLKTESLITSSRTSTTHAIDLWHKMQTKRYKTGNYQELDKAENGTITEGVHSQWGQIDTDDRWTNSIPTDQR